MGFFPPHRAEHWAVKLTPIPLWIGGYSLLFEYVFGSRFISENVNFRPEKGAVI